MADVDDTLPEWSATAENNKPTGATVIGAGLDDNLREIQKVVRGWLATKGADIASATTTDLGAIEGLMHDITGTTTITGFGTIAAGIWKIIKFEGALTLTHNATSLILPGAANITTAVGDVGIFMSEGSGNWRCHAYLFAGDSRRVTSAGEETKPLQPAFSAYNSATDLNVTGNGTQATVDFDTEVFDQGGDFAADTFTAPMAGRYQLNAHVSVEQISGATGVALRIVTSNRTYLKDTTLSVNAGQVDTCLSLSVLADMDAADTATVTIAVKGVGADTSDVTGGLSHTFFSGFLAC